MYRLCTVTRRQEESIILSPKSRKQYEGIYVEVKVEIKILKGKTTNIQARYGIGWSEKNNVPVCEKQPEV